MMLTLSQFCDRLQIDEKTAYRLLRETNLQSSLVDKKRMVNSEDLDRWCQQNPGIVKALGIVTKQNKAKAI